MTKATILPDHLKKYLIPAFDRKAKSITAINLKDLTSYTDVIVIIEAGSNRQVSSIAQHMVKSLKTQKIKVLGSEGIKQGAWALLDYGEIVIHIFESEAKSFYDLEGFWADAPVFDLTEFGEIFEQEEDDGYDD